jgi:hypothetical protein
MAKADKIKCKECGKEFETNPKWRYPRKFCDKCSEQRKKDYQNLYLLTADDCED